MHCKRWKQGNQWKQFLAVIPPSFFLHSIMYLSIVIIFCNFTLTWNFDAANIKTNLQKLFWQGWTWKGKILLWFDSPAKRWCVWHHLSSKAAKANRVRSRSQVGSQPTSLRHHSPINVSHCLMSLSPDCPSHCQDCKIEKVKVIALQHIDSDVYKIKWTLTIAMMSIMSFWYPNFQPGFCQGRNWN